MVRRTTIMGLIMMKILQLLLPFISITTTTLALLFLSSLFIALPPPGVDAAAFTTSHHHHNDLHNDVLSSSSLLSTTRRIRSKYYPSTTTTTIRRFMFTGIVEEMGTVIALEQRNDMKLWDGSIGSGTFMTIQGDGNNNNSSDDNNNKKKKSVIMDGAYLGCSICVSGACLTATHLDFDKQQFTVGLAPETLRRTNLGQLVPSRDNDNTHKSKVNLERASEIGGRNSGHFVQGHVDCTGTILERTLEGDSIVYKIKVDDPSNMSYIVRKGFIAVDGTSLTVVDVNMLESWFTFMLVEYTQKKIIIPNKFPGASVNLEVDVLGKYSENAMATLIPRIAILEEKVKLLEQQLSLQKQQQQQQKE